MPSPIIPVQDPFPPAPERSWLRPKRVIFALVLAVVGGAGYWATSVATLTPGKPGKFTATLNALVADAQADAKDAPNSWAKFSEACELCRSIGQKQVDRPRPAGLPEGWTSDHVSWPLSPEQIANPNISAALTPIIREELIAIIKEHEVSGLLEKLDEVAAGKRFVRELPADTKTIETLLPELGAARSTARLCKARMFLAAERGDGPEFIRAARHALTLGSLLKKQVTLIDHLVGVAIDALSYGCIREAIVRGQLSPETCRELLTMLSARASAVDVDRGLRAEHLQVKDTVEWTHSDDGNGNGLFIGSDLIQSYTSLGSTTGSKLPRALTNFAGVVLPRKRETLAVFDELFEKSRAYAALPLRQRLAAESPDVGMDRLSKRQILPRILMPAFGRYIEIADQTDLVNAGTKIMLALELHKAAKGSYPGSLAQLEPSLASLGVKEIWVNELRYKTLDPGTDPDRRGYLLYWIGIDNKDDNGHVHPKEGSQAAWRKSNVGFDYVMNEPIEKPAPPAPAPAEQPEAQPGDATTVPASEPQAAPK